MFGFGLQWLVELEPAAYNAYSMLTEGVYLQCCEH